MSEQRSALQSGEDQKDTVNIPSFNHFSTQSEST